MCETSLPSRKRYSLTACPRVTSTRLPGLCETLSSTTLPFLSSMRTRRMPYCSMLSSTVTGFDERTAVPDEMWNRALPNAGTSFATKTNSPVERRWEGVGTPRSSCTRSPSMENSFGTTTTSVRRQDVQLYTSTAAESELASRLARALARSASDCFSASTANARLTFHCCFVSMFSESDTLHQAPQVCSE